MEVLLLSTEARAQSMEARALSMEARALSMEARALSMEVLVQYMVLFMVGQCMVQVSDQFVISSSLN